MAAQGEHMRAIDIRTPLVGATLVLTLTGCGPTETTEPAHADNPGDSSPNSADLSDNEQEPITTRGIAAVVLQHLGGDTVRQFLAYEQEPGSVSVMVRLRDDTPHNFAVQVYSPEQAEMFGAAGTCPGEREPEGTFRCRTLSNGTTVTTLEDAHGFSDDNADGMVISGTAVTPEDGGVLALYESYDDSPAITMADLEDLLIDPRLTWLTDPAVNRGGAEIDLEETTG
jgi:hypothetical protein